MFQESESDYLELFKPDAAWSKSAQNVKVFMINGGLLLRQSDDEVKAVFADLERRHIALAIEMGLATARQDRSGHQACGVNVEGITTPDATRVIAQRIRKNGGELRYVAMDEPLWYGHHFSGTNACHFTLSELASTIAPNVTVLREIFPSVEIGDVEPVGAAKNVPPDWADEIAQWTQVYQQVVGQKLSFFHADIAWASPWQQQLGAVKRVAHERGLKFGIIYDGGGTPGKQESDNVWTQEAEERFRLVESAPSLVPDHAVFQSWARWPHNMLPETQPGTMTNLVLQYVQQHIAPVRVPAQARSDSSTPQIWFNMTNYQMSNGVDGPQGWNKLFGDPNAPWPEFMNHVQVVAAAGIWQTPDDLSAKAFSKLKQHHMPFAMESLAQNWVHEPECGQGVESYYDPPGARKTAEKIKAAGGELAYVAMDEPLFYGRYYNGHDACHSSIENVAERAAAIIREYKKVFPNVIVGDIEPFPAITDQPDWQNEYRQWMKAFNAALGQPIAFLQIDINWGRNNWPQSLKETVNFAHDTRLPIGIIYNGDSHGDGGTSQGWLESAVQNFTQIEKQMGVHPDQAIFHSWDKFPIHSISDPSGPGEDYLVKRYLQQHGVQ